MRRAAAALVVAALAAACGDTFTEHGCEEREAATITHALVDDDEPEPTCEEACTRSLQGELRACERLPDPPLDGGPEADAVAPPTDAAVDALAVDAGRVVRARSVAYYCEYASAPGKCGRR